MDPAWVAFWVSFGMTLLGSVITGTIIYATLKERVRVQGLELEKVAVGKVSREEFAAAMQRLDQLHADLRETRELLIQNLTNARGSA